MFWYRTAIGGHHDRRAEDHRPEQKISEPRLAWIILIANDVILFDGMGHVRKCHCSNTVVTE